MDDKEKLRLRETALEVASRINTKEVVIEEQEACMVGHLAGVEKKGSVTQLLNDAEKIYHWLKKDC